MLLDVINSSRTVLFDYPPRYMVHLVSGSCHYQTWVLSYGVNLQCNQVVVGYSHNCCATIAYHADRSG